MKTNMRKFEKYFMQNKLIIKVIKYISFLLISILFEHDFFSLLCHICFGPAK